MKIGLLKPVSSSTNSWRWHKHWVVGLCNVQSKVPGAIAIWTYSRLHLRFRRACPWTFGLPLQEAVPSG